MGRRPAGTGNLFVRSDASGGETFYATWYAGARKVKRRIGPKRLPGTRLGLTKTRAEAELRRLIGEVRPSVPREERITFQEAAERYVDHLETVMERKRTTVQDYRCMMSAHLAPFFAGRAIDRIDPQMVAAYLSAKRREGLAAKTCSNHLTFAHGVFAYAVKRGWALSNPVAAVDRPREPGSDPDIRFLDDAELEALLRAVPDDVLGATEGVLYLAAALTGLRQGELFALRWRDIDWPSGVIRVRRNYTRGQFGTPKARRSSRAVPMADRLAGELERHYQRSRFTGDDDLAFAHPGLGTPLDASKVRKRFGAALARAGVREITFHGLRHTFGTSMAAAGAPMRAIMEWMGHRSLSTTLIYADYAPDPSNGAAYVERAFGARGSTRGSKMSENEVI